MLNDLMFLLSPAQTQRRCARKFVTAIKAIVQVINAHSGSDVETRTAHTGGAREKYNSIIFHLVCSILFMERQRWVGERGQVEDMKNDQDE